MFFLKNIPHSLHAGCLRNPLCSFFTSAEVDIQLYFSPVSPPSLPLAVLQVSVRINEGGYTIIQLSFRTGLDHLKGFTLKRGSLRTKNTEYLSSLPFLSVTFLKTHLAWI